MFSCFFRKKRKPEDKVRFERPFYPIVIDRPAPNKCVKGLCFLVKLPFKLTYYALAGFFITCMLANPCTWYAISRAKKKRSRDAQRNLHRSYHREKMRLSAGQQVLEQELSKDAPFDDSPVSSPFIIKFGKN